MQRKTSSVVLDMVLLQNAVSISMQWLEIDNIVQADNTTTNTHTVKVKTSAKMVSNQPRM